MIHVNESVQLQSGGGRPKDGYFLASGLQVPSVTTVLKYKDPGPLMGWAYNQGKAGKSFRETRDAAADAGKLAHSWIEARLHGLPIVIPPNTLPDIVEKAEMGLEAFDKWRTRVHLQVIDTERPLVSELHSIGGTYDCLARVEDELVLMDWKSGGGVYPETVSQLAAYRQLIRENVGHKRELAPESAWCLRVGRDFGDFHDHFYNSVILDSGWRRFLGAKAMYDEDETCLKRVCT